MIEKKNSNLYFVHANGFLPDAYKMLFQNLPSKLNINNYLLLKIFKDNKNLKLKNWIIYHDSFINSIKENKIIGMGHSIGGNIVLRSAITHQKLFKSVILLDPTLFVPKVIFFWKLFYYLNIQNRFHPWLNSTLNRKMEYENYNTMFNAYRKKEVFSKIDDQNLKIYIDSLIEYDKEKCKIIYPKEYEYSIYKTGLLEDNFIWKNIHKISIPTLIIRAEESNAFLEDAANKVTKLNKNIKIITMKNTSHLFPLEKPIETSNLINEFISKYH